MLVLPDTYREQMQHLLEEEYSSYLESFSKASHSAFRINTLKVSKEAWHKMNPFSTREVSWNAKGFYYDEEVERPAKHPYYFAGLYYIQEPSAMIPANLLPIEAGDRVLDLCAAPGGKATELGAKLRGTGVLVANDISVSRTKPLTKNLQMAGISNAIVTAETPEHLAAVFHEFFDKILIDAPCSGEGMFRKEPRMISDWLEKGPEYYQKIQREILREAYTMLVPGGQMVYSTCTFSVKEDEENIQWFLSEYPDMKMCKVKREPGYAPGKPEKIPEGMACLQECVRIFPHLAEGEGHFAVLLSKAGEQGKSEKDSAEQIGQADEPEPVEKVAETTEDSKSKSRRLERLYKRIKDPSEKKAIQDFLEHFTLESEGICYQKGKLSYDPLPGYALTGLRVVMRGVQLAEWKHKLLPTPQSALLLSAKDYPQVLDLSCEDERVIRFLKGETISGEKSCKGNVLVCVDGYGLGWCQGMGNGNLKNKYHPGWRYQ